MSQKFLWLSGLCLLASLSLSQEFDSVETPSTLSTVYSEFVPASTTYPEFSSTSVTVIQADQFRASDVTVADIVDSVPSVQLQKTGETGSYTSLSVRGAPSQQTQIYIDGVLQSNVAGEGGQLQHILLADVERIEIYPGSAPAQLAQGSPGGAINIVRRSAVNNSAQVTLETGSFGHQRFAAFGQWSQGRWSTSASLEQLQVDNDFPFLNDNGTPINNEDDEWETRNNAAYQMSSGSLSTRYRLGDQEYAASLTALSSKKELPDAHNTEIQDAYYEQDDVMGLLSAHFNGWAPSIDTSLRLQLQQNQGRYYDPASSIGLSANDSRDETQSRQLQQTSILAVPQGLITLHNSLHYDAFTLQDSLKGTTVEADRSQFSSSLGGEWFVSGAVTASGAVRQLRFTETSVDAGDHEDNLMGGQLSLRVDGDHQSLQLSSQQSYRVANVLERFGNIGSFKGNDALENETSVSSELSYQFKTDAIAMGVSAYYRESDNTIAPIFNSQGVGQYINIGDATFYGVEWQAEAKMDTLVFTTNGALHHSFATSQFKAYDQKQVPGYYPVSLNQGVEWAFAEHWTTQWGYRYAAGLYYDRANSTQAPTKHLVDAALQWQNPHVTVTAQIENLLNDYNLDFSRKVQPGRSFKLTLEYRIGE